jgi:signal recognition particle subunit SRP54
LAFENLTEKLSSVFKKLGIKGKLSENDVKSAMREIRIAFLEADVNYSVVKKFTEKISERAIGTDIMKSLNPAQMVVKIVNEELIALLGGSQQTDNEKITAKFSGSNFLKLSSDINIIMLCGLQGAGKTTQAAKLGLYLKNKSNTVLLVACDIYRPAAVEQLKILGNNIGVKVFYEENATPVEITRNAISFAKDNGCNIVILDTAGRLHIDEALMQELENIKNLANPSEILLTIDAMVGQDSVNIAQAFNNRLSITGVVLTKFDGDARGGVALSVLYTIGKPIKFVGTGEKMGDLEPFYPDRIASRILGMGDVLSLIETAQANINEKDAEKVAKKFMENKFDFEDFLNLFTQIKKLGPMKKILEKMPGASNLKNLNVDDKMLDKNEAIIFSMTPKERRNPEIISRDRISRIANGSGRKAQDVNDLIKRFNEMRKLMKQFRNGKGGIFEKMKMFSKFK